MRSGFQIHVTAVANEFIDQYMASANGEYVKEYLYILRHQEEPVTVEIIADALNHTESDVRRAIAYWEKVGVLVKQGEREAQGSIQVQKEERPAVRAAKAAGAETVASISPIPVTPVVDRKIPKARPNYSPEKVNQLAQEEEFTQLLYIAQKYMNKVFTPRECELFAYLYDGIHMSADLLEYLVEYCVQSGHSNIRYMETVALNWHEKGLLTVEMAKAYTSSYTKDAFAVMKAFGLTNRKPGEMEVQIIRRWFKEYGFTKEVVVEACNRTLAAIHNPSFQYADKILSEWKKAGVRRFSDIKALDERRESRNATKPPVAAKNNKNQFHNFEQRDTNYDALMLERLKERMGEQ